MADLRNPQYSRHIFTLTYGNFVDDSITQTQPDYGPFILFIHIVQWLELIFADSHVARWVATVAAVVTYSCIFYWQISYWRANKSLF